MFNALYIALTIYIHSVTGLPLPANPPLIEYKTACQVAVFADPKFDCTRLNDHNEGRAVAYYDPATKAITLNIDAKPDDLYDLSIFLHELVHYMQDMSGQLEKYPCMGEAEKVAYETQIHFLHNAGIADPLDFMHIYPLSYMLITSCEMPY